MSVQRLRITAVVELDAACYPPDDDACQDWLINDILLGDSLGRLILHSNEIGDSLGIVHVETVAVISEEAS
jgi:hypothetical protein